MQDPRPDPQLRRGALEQKFAAQMDSLRAAAKVKADTDAQAMQQWFDAGMQQLRSASSSPEPRSVEREPLQLQLQEMQDSLREQQADQTREEELMVVELESMESRLQQLENERDIGLERLQLAERTIVTMKAERIAEEELLMRELNQFDPFQMQLLRDQIEEAELGRLRAEQAQQQDCATAAPEVSAAVNASACSPVHRLTSSAGKAGELESRLRCEIGQLNAQIQTMQQQKEASAQEAAGLRQDNQALRAVVRWEEELVAQRAADTEQRMVVHRRAEDTTASKNEQLKRQLDDALARTVVLADSSAAADRESKTVAAENDKLKKQLQSALARAQVIEECLAVVEQESRTTVAETVARMEQQQQQATAQATTLEGGVAVLTQELVAATAETEALKEREMRSKDSDSQLETLTAANKVLLRQQQQTDARVGTQDERIAALKLQLEASTMEQAALKQQLEAAAAENGSLKEQREHFMRRLNQLEEQPEVVNAAHSPGSSINSDVDVPALAALKLKMSHLASTPKVIASSSELEAADLARHQLLAAAARSISPVATPLERPVEWRKICRSPTKNDRENRCKPTKSARCIPSTRTGCYSGTIDRQPTGLARLADFGQVDGGGAFC